VIGEIFDAAAARLIWGMWGVSLIAGAAGGAILLGAGWVWGYLSRCRDEREAQLSDEWRAERARQEQQGVKEDSA